MPAAHPCWLQQTRERYMKTHKQNVVAKVVVVITAKCVVPNCPEQESFEVDSIAFYDWDISRKRVRDCFPQLTVDQAEMLISGICPKCWNKVYDEEVKHA